jgi:hypothetical protein
MEFCFSNLFFISGIMNYGLEIKEMVGVGSLKPGCICNFVRFCCFAEVWNALCIGMLMRGDRNNILEMEFYENREVVRVGVAKFGVNGGASAASRRFAVAPEAINSAASCASGSGRSV